MVNAPNWCEPVQLLSVQAGLQFKDPDQIWLAWNFSSNWVRSPYPIDFLSWLDLAGVTKSPFELNWAQFANPSALLSQMKFSVKGDPGMDGAWKAFFVLSQIQFIKKYYSSLNRFISLSFDHNNMIKIVWDYYFLWQIHAFLFF